MVTLRPSLIALCFATSTLVFAACGDDGNFIGSDGNTAGSSQNNGGSSGSAHAGTSNAGNTNNGGDTNHGGSTNHGGTNNGGSANNGGTCQAFECLRANVCLDQCGGKVVYTGCCACPVDTVETLTCDSAGGQGGGGSGGGRCADTTCGAGETCVAHRTVGGALIPPSEGHCPPGKHLESQTCQNDFSYACAALDCTANGCHCAAQTSCAYATSCKQPYVSQWLNTDADLVCEQLAP